jgi:small subunit ribosomal protein S19
MPRSLKKGPYIDPGVAKKVANAKATNSTKIEKVWGRSSVITPEMVGLTIGVHNGKGFTDVYITEQLVGRKLGELAPTKKFVKHGGSKSDK